MKIPNPKIPNPKIPFPILLFVSIISVILVRNNEMSNIVKLIGLALVSVVGFVLCVINEPDKPTKP